MNFDERAAFWNNLDEAGATQVRKLLAMGIWGEDRTSVAKAWLQHHDASRNSEDSAALIVEARSSNTLAREANEFAREANAVAQDANSLAETANRVAAKAAASAATQARAANTNNTIAVASAIMAAIALAISIWTMTHTDHGAPHVAQAQPHAKVKTH